MSASNDGLGHTFLGETDFIDVLEGGSFFICRGATLVLDLNDESGFTED